MQFHINPHYLSPGDRLLAKITSYAVNDDGSVKWVPDFRRFSGLYRCHICFCVWDTRSSLTSHLSSCRVDEFDVDENDDNAPLKQFRRKKRRRKSGEENGDNGVDENKSAQSRVDENGVDQKKIDEKDGSNVTQNGDERAEGDKILSARKGDTNCEFEAQLESPRETSEALSLKVDEMISLNVEEVGDLKFGESTVAQDTTEISKVEDCSDQTVPDDSDKLSLENNAERSISEKSLEEDDEKTNNLVKEIVCETSVDELNLNDQKSTIFSDSEKQQSEEASKMLQTHDPSDVSSDYPISKAQGESLESKNDSDEATTSESKSSRKRRSVASKSTPTKVAEVESEMKRPERSCKTTTKALMKLTFTEDYDFADDSDASVSSDGDDRKSVDTSSVQTSHLDEDKTETSSLQSEDVESNASRFVKSFGLKLEMNN